MQKLLGHLYSLKSCLQLSVIRLTGLPRVFQNVLYASFLNLYGMSGAQSLHMMTDTHNKRLLKCILWPVCDTYAPCRGSLSRRLWRFWRRCKARLKRVLSVIIAWPIALHHSLLRGMAACWSCSPSMPVKPEGSQDQKHFLADFDDRPILNGIVAEKTHSHVD